MNRNHFCKVRTHFYHDATTYERLCDRRVVEEHFKLEMTVATTLGYNKEEIASRD